MIVISEESEDSLNLCLLIMQDIFLSKISFTNKFYEFWLARVSMTNQDEFGGFKYLVFRENSFTLSSSEFRYVGK